MAGRLKLRVRYVSWWSNVLVGLFVVSCALLILLIGVGGALEDAWWTLGFLPVGVAVAVLGVRAFRAGVELGDDAIIVRNMASTRRYPWSQIRRASVEAIPANIPLDAYTVTLWLAADRAGALGRTGEQPGEADKPVALSCLAVYSFESRLHRTVAAKAAAAIQRRLATDTWPGTTGGPIPERQSNSWSQPC